MFHNKKTGDIESLSPTKVLRQHVRSLYLNNKLSGQETEKLQAEIAECKVPGFKVRKGFSKNRQVSQQASRNLLRRSMKHSQWPPIYAHEIRVFDPKKQIECLAKVAFMLPHEILFALGDFNTAETLTVLSSATESVQKHCLEAQSQWGVPVAALGLWSDGTPFNWERSKSLELLLINFPGLDSTWRFPIAAIPHEHISKHATFEDIFSLVAWSFQQCAVGKMPFQRHDGSPWTSNDTWRKKRAGKPLPCKAVLAEVRADWKCMSEVFHLPHWQNTLGICCKCSATLGNFKDFSSLAPWRSERLNHWQFLERQLLQGKKVSAIYHCPLFSTSCFKIGWLHTMDLGVSCDTLGNLCWHLLPKFAGKRSDQVAALFLTMKDFYTRNNVETRLFNLTEKMIRSSAKTSPKLKTRAGETRALVPWAWEIAQTMLDQLDPFEQAIFFAIKYLHQAYQCLSKKNFQHQHFHDVCFKFLLQYQALEFLAPEYTWYIKPKFHGMAELALAFDNPSMNWVYRDEEAGGTLARLGRSKGNLQTPWSVSINVLQRFAAEFSVPAF